MHVLHHLDHLVGSTWLKVYIKYTYALEIHLTIASSMCRSDLKFPKIMLKYFYSWAFIVSWNVLTKRVLPILQLHTPFGVLENVWKKLFLKCSLLDSKIRTYAHTNSNWSNFANGSPFFIQLPIGWNLEATTMSKVVVVTQFI